ncbi:transposase [Methanocaldococcus indicus]|uniref:transposase n=1 Tax=Methanocaldococcus indicus TaxID=213231 RepID=UPI003C6D27FC
MKPKNIKSTDIYLRIIESISKIIKGTVVGDGSVTIKKILRRCKELGVDYIGRIRKNIKIEVFGKEVKIENMFKMDFNKNKTKLRTINGKKFRISEKVVNIPNVGKVKIVAVLMEEKKKIKYLVSTNYKKKAENIINEYLKRCKIEEKHRRDKSILEVEENYLSSEKSNIGFVRLMGMLFNCIEYLSYKNGISFYKVIKECSKELIKNGLL